MPTAVHFRRLLAIALAIGLATSFGLASSQQTSPSQQRPVFRGSAVLVTVDAYPQRDGRIVEGLTAKDFEIVEDGKPQALEEVEFVRVEPAVPEATRRDPNTQAEALALAADPRNRVFIAFLDAQHTTVDGSHAIRKPLVDTLNRVMGPTDLFGVLTPNLDPRYLVLGRRLLSVDEQLSRYWPWGQRERLTRDPENPIEDALWACFHSYSTPNGFVDWIVDEDGEKRYLYDVLVDRSREDRTLTSLERMVEHLAGLREARTVVFVVTDGWLLYPPNDGLANEMGRWPARAPGVYVGPGSRLGVARGPEGGDDRAGCNGELVRLAKLDNARRFRDLMTDANRHNVTFYPVAPTGLGVFDVSPTTRKQLPGSTGMPMERNLDRRKFRLDALRTAAENTDGLAVVDTNDLSAGLRRVVDDVSAYYLLRYYSTNTRNDGGFRKISVKLRQPAGIHLRARRGYLAPSDTSRAARGAAPAATAAAPTAAPIEGLAEALGMLSRLGSSTELFTRGVVDGSELAIAVEIPAGQAAGGGWGLGADVSVTVTDAAGSGVGTASARMAAATRGALVRVALTAPGGGPWRVVSKVTAGTATIEDRTEVRATPADLLGPPLLYRGTPAATSPLRPVADFQYRRTERVRVEWRLAEADALDNRSARLLGRSGQPLAVPVALIEQTTDGRRALAADVNLAPLSAGDYLIEVVVGRGSRTFRTLVAIRVVP